MKTLRFAFPAGAVLAAAVAAGPAQAQPCGPLTFQITTTGPGCDPSGSGFAPPVLSASLLPPAVNPACSVQILLNSLSLFPIPTTPLALGLSNPAFPFPGLAGCVLWTTLDILLAMPTDASGPAAHSVILLVPPDPSLIGVSVYAQAALPVFGGVRFSNGIRIDIV